MFVLLICIFICYLRRLRRRHLDTRVYHPHQQTWPENPRVYGHTAEANVELPEYSRNTRSGECVLQMGDVGMEEELSRDRAVGLEDEVGGGEGVGYELGRPGEAVLK